LKRGQTESCPEGKIARSIRDEQNSDIGDFHGTLKVDEGCDNDSYDQGILGSAELGLSLHGDPQ
jgi:hypothetical protein